MRERKFKLWDKELKFMVDISKYHMTFDGHIFFNNNGDLINQTEKLEIIEYTSLKDVKGKEVYEGDIIFNDDAETICIVEFEDGKFITNYRSEDCFGKIKERKFDLKSTLGNLYCVIGNIYENGELSTTETNSVIITLNPGLISTDDLPF